MTKFHKKIDTNDFTKAEGDLLLAEKNMLSRLIVYYERRGRFTGRVNRYRGRLELLDKVINKHAEPYRKRTRESIPRLPEEINFDWDT